MQVFKDAAVLAARFVVRRLGEDRVRAVLGLAGPVAPDNDMQKFVGETLAIFLSEFFDLWSKRS